jgi:hypothetical protein
MIDFFSGLLRKKGQNQSQELRRFIFAAAYEHNKECSETFCEFASITVFLLLDRPKRSSRT